MSASNDVNRIEAGDLLIEKNDAGEIEIHNLAEGQSVTIGAEGLSLSSLLVGANTVISESSQGSTTIENEGGNPVNIQLAPSGRAFLTGNYTTTTIDTQNEWYQISGGWNEAHMNFLTHDGNGVLTYNGDVTTQVTYDVGGAYSSENQNATYEIAMFKDGEVKPNTQIEFSPPRAGETLGLPTIFGFTDITTSGMSHSVRVRCTSGADDLTVHSLSFRLKG